MKIELLIILILISFGTISYFYTEESNREIVREVFREIGNFTLKADYRERHLFLYFNKYLIKECNGLNRTECRAFLSSFGWRLAVRDDIVRVNITIIDNLINTIVDTWNKIEFGAKIFIADFGYYFKIWLYRAEVMSVMGPKRAYFPELYVIPDKLFDIKIDEEMKLLLETPSVLVIVYYESLKTILYGWIGAVWLLFYLIIDETIMQLLFASTLINVLVWVTREAAYYGVNKISGGYIKFWMFQKFSSLLVETGVFDIFSNGITLVIILRVILILIGLPYLFNFGAVYFVAIILLYCFYYLISHMQTKVKYQVELKIKADVNVKQGAPMDLGFYSFTEKLGLWFMESFWNMTPFFLRLYREGWEFRPFLDLTAPTKGIFYLALISLPFVILIVFVFDLVIYLLAWATVYVWFYPYVFNKRIAESKWLVIMKSIESRSVIISNETLKDSDGYFYNLVRSWLLICGFYRLNAEEHVPKSRFKEFLRDIIDSLPVNDRFFWVKRYEMPYRYLKGKVLQLQPTLEEKALMYEAGLEADALMAYGTKDIRLLWTKGSKDSTKLTLAKSQIDALFINKFGVGWRGPLLIPEQPVVPEHIAKHRENDYYKLISKDFVIEDPIYGFKQFVMPRPKVDWINKIVAIGQELADIGDIPDISTMDRIDSLYLISYIRYYVMSIYSEDMRDLDIIKGIPDEFYINDVDDKDFCKTVVVQANILANYDIKYLIAQSLYTQKVVVTSNDLHNYLIKDAYWRLNMLYKGKVEEKQVPLDNIRLETGRSFNPEYRDYVEPGYEELRKQLEDVTLIHKGSILTQLGHLINQGITATPVVDAMSKFRKRLFELKHYQVYPLYQHGLPIGDVSASNDIVLEIHHAIAKDREIYNEFLTWLNSFDKRYHGMMILWFIYMNKEFMYRFIDKSRINGILAEHGMTTKNRVWLQPEAHSERIKQDFYNALDKLKKLSFTDTKEDDEYIELEDFSNPLSKFDYGNMSKLEYTISDGRELVKGLKTIGRQKLYSAPNLLIYVNKYMADLLPRLYPQGDLRQYEIVNPTHQLVREALDKYRRRKFEFNQFSVYKGTYFKPWLMKQLDDLYRVHQGYKVKIRTIDSFSVEDLSLQSRRASPGFLTNRNGVRNKADKLDMTKEWAKSYRKSVLMGDALEHIWMTIIVPKTCKPTDKQVRVVNAPEMYFYINQFLLYEPFVRLSKFSKVTSDFCLFFGDFDKAVRKHKHGHIIESLDLRNQGGRIQHEVMDLFLEWYSRFFDDTRDINMLYHVSNDIINAKFMLPTNYGGHIFQKNDGWCDGPYGTNQFDTFAMVIYYLINCWINTVEQGLDLDDVNSDNFTIESHGDNWLHSYHPNLKKQLTWKPSNLNDLGQEVKDSISVSKDPVGLELMGFLIKREGDLYVGTRPTGKTLKSLIYNKKKYDDLETQRGYEKSIIMCLQLVDCWNNDAYVLLNQLYAQYSSVTPHIVTLDAEYKHFILSELGLNPRLAWTYESKKSFEVSEIDPTDISSWV